MFNPLVSLFRTIGLALAGRIHFPRDRIGEMFGGEGSHNFRIFRQVIIGPDSKQPGAIFHVHFRIAGMSSQQNKLFSLLPIPFIIGLPGFRSKLWIADDATGDCQGIYGWDSCEQAEKYAASFAMRFMTMRAVKGTVWYRIAATKKV